MIAREIDTEDKRILPLQVTLQMVKKAKERGEDISLGKGLALSRFTGVPLDYILELTE